MIKLLTLIIFLGVWIKVVTRSSTPGFGWKRQQTVRMEHDKFKSSSDLHRTFSSS